MHSYFTGNVNFATYKHRETHNMAFGKFAKKGGFKKAGFKKGGFKKGGTAKKNGFDNTNITGLWATKKDNLFVGTVNELDDLIALVKKAKAAEKGITFFLWYNGDDSYAPFNLVGNVAQDRPDGIKEEEGEEQQEEESTDEL